jgi:hypothetical protein
VESTPGVSRAGSQVMKSGRRGGREEELEVERRGEALTMSIIWAILSSSSGQMSGQCVKPKYTYSQGSH